MEYVEAIIGLLNLLQGPVDSLKDLEEMAQELLDASPEAQEILEEIKDVLELEVGQVLEMDKAAAGLFFLEDVEAAFQLTEKL